MSALHRRIGILFLAALPVFPGAVIYNNDTPNNLMAAASRPDSTGLFEIETADDFILASATHITSATFTGILTAGAGLPTVQNVIVEIYRVFPNDSGPASGHVPTRANSPSDVAFDTADASLLQISFSTAVLAASFTALNSVQPGGINPLPGSTTGGNGQITGQEVQFNINFTTPLDLPADHYFFVPQVQVEGGSFYWLSAARPVGAPFTFAPDLQGWTRDAGLAPDWLRVGTDIVGGATPPTYNFAFSLTGDTVPEPSSLALGAIGLAFVALRWGRHSWRRAG